MLWLFFCHQNANCRGLGLECCWKPPNHVPKCLLSCLTMVYFRGFEGLKYQLRVVEYILNNARVLKMMDICTNGIGDMPLESKLDTLRKLSMFPRGSKTCQLQFNWHICLKDTVKSSDPLFNSSSYNEIAWYDNLLNLSWNVGC